MKIPWYKNSVVYMKTMAVIVTLMVMAVCGMTMFVTGFAALIFFDFLTRII